MPRARTKPETIEVPTGVDPATLPAMYEEETEPTEEDALIGLLTELGSGPEGDGSVTVFKFNEEVKKREWVDRMSASEFLAQGLPYLASQHGGGDYEFYIYDANTKLSARRKVSIAKTAVTLRDKQTQANIDDSPVFAELLEMQKQTQVILQQLAVGISSQNKSPSRMEMLEEMRAFREILVPGETSAPAANPIEMFRGMAEIMKDITPSEGDPSMVDTLMKFAEKFGPAIQDALKNSVPAAGQLPVNPAGQSAANSGAIPTAQSQPTGDNVAMFQNQLIKMYLNVLVDSAVQNEDPHPHAEIVVNKVPENVLREWLAKPSLAEELSKYNPGVAQHHGWFEELKTMILAILDQPAENEPGTAPAPADINVIPAGAATETPAPEPGTKTE